MSEKRKLPVGGIALALSGGTVIAAVGAVMIITRNADVNAPTSDALPGIEARIPSGTPPTDEPLISIQSAPQAPRTPEPGAAMAESGAAISYSDPLMSFSASLPKGDPNDPILLKLRKEAEGLLASAKRDAQAAAAERQGSSQPALEWDYQLQWSELARAGDIVSLMGTYYTFTGGAHGMAKTDTRIMRAKSAEVIEFSNMMRFGKTPSPALVIAGCEAVKRAKRDTLGDATIFDEPIVCAGPNANVRLSDASVALAPSNAVGKFGGIYVYFDPYVIGAYAEGSYEIVVQQDAFADDLKPEFRALFNGTAPPPK